MEGQGQPPFFIWRAVEYMDSDCTTFLGSSYQEGTPGCQEHGLKSNLLLLVHVGTNDAASQKINRIKEVYKALVRQVKNIDPEVMFSSILLVREIGTARSR